MALSVMKMLVLSASRYDFEDSSSHRQVRGLSVLTAPLSASASGDLVGAKPAKTTLDYSRFAEFPSDLPAVADVEFDLDLATMKIVPSRFSNFVSLASLAQD